VSAKEGESFMTEPANGGEKSPNGSAKYGPAVILGTVGLVFTATQVWLTYKKDDFDRESKKFDVIVSLFQKCSSDQASDRAFANRMIGSQKSDGFSIAAFNQYFAKDGSFNQALTTCSKILSNAAAVTQPETTIVPPLHLPSSALSGPSAKASSSSGPSTPSAPPNDGPRFWIYLGTYENAVWETKYINIPNDFDPAKFASDADQNKGQYKVRDGTPLNLRYGVFSPTGDFPPPTRVLQPNQKVTLRSTAQWFDSGNWWATIEPPSDN
jgi:hypothetical protein